ncbi:MAG TPA: head GIN domain-containing protein [Candidatus Sabulitectum sp.]|nr:head GIN domain-containing protein [Candidatus Sabulitectum sp.]HPF33560.1 head GIN domain-containing protein [Candidatus Sabulitectum sp.]HPJ28434.1 head GIN domain-containing protein [Candidatus Sabulitectum sp.]HPR22028.1 head GIN domain-containing protein [Candidatus Sabulitectum sp.]
MTVMFFGREIENPILKILVAAGAAVFAAALAALVLLLVLPLLAAVLTGALLVVAVILVLLVVFLPFVAFLGVVFSRREKGSGNRKSETRVLEPFDSVRISGVASVEVTCGGEQQVTVSTDDNLLDNLETSVTGGELRISISKPAIWKQAPGIAISLPLLKSLNASGACRAEISGVSSEELSLRGSGAAKISASGEAKSLKLRISGAGKIDCSDLKSVSAVVSIAGAGKVRVHASEELQAKVSGAGRVVYFGDPAKVERRVSGAGRIDPG